MIEVHGRNPKEVMMFVAQRSGCRPEWLVPCAASGFYKDGVLSAGMVVHNHRPTQRGAVAEISAAVDDPRHAVRGMFKIPLDYVFGEAGITRLEAKVSKENARCRRFVLKLGFTEEGLLRAGWDGCGDAVMYSLLASDPCPVRGV